MSSKSSKRIVECQIDSGASCNVVSHLLACKQLQDGNPKLQESKSKLQMYDGSVMLPYGINYIKCEVNQASINLQFLSGNYKKRIL